MVFGNLRFCIKGGGVGVKRWFANNKKQDYYSILGVPKSATQSEIKKAFAKLAREYHPDKNPSPEAKDRFTAISEAYSTLSDQKKRDIYDQTGMSSDEQKQYQNSGFDPGAGFDFSDFFRQGGQEGTGGFEDLFRDFGDIFGGGGKSNRPTRGPDVVISIELDFNEAVGGVTKDVSYRLKDICGTCNGSRCKPGTNPEKCIACGGSGVNTLRQGGFHIQTPCGSCRGEGMKIKSPCTNCKGSGVASILKKESLTIPKGVNTGQSLRISGKGNKGEKGGPSGDLIVKLNVRSDPYFRREGYDIYVNINVSIGTAVLGGTVSVRCLNGERKISIPAGTSSGRKIRLPNEGVTKLAPNHNQKGDQYIIINVTIPTNLSSKEREIFEQLRALENPENKSVEQKGAEVENEGKGFFNKIFNHKN